MVARARLFDFRRFLADRLLSRMFGPGPLRAGTFRAGTFQSRVRSAFEPRNPRPRLAWKRPRA